MISPTIKTRKSKIKNGAGFTLLEVSVSGVLLIVVMVVAVRLLGWAAVERRAADRRQWAVQEAANVMERLSAMPWDSLTGDRVAPQELSPQARDLLPDGELKVQVTSDPSEPNAKRLAVEVTWQQGPGRRAAPVRLIAWFYRSGVHDQ